MRKFLLVLGILGLVASVSFGLSPKNSDFSYSSAAIIYNTTLTTAETVYAVTLAQGTTAQIDMQAIGGDIYYCLGGTTTEAKWTISSGATRWNQYLLPLPKDTALYFWSATSGVTIEVYQNYLDGN